MTGFVFMTVFFLHATVTSAQAPAAKQARPTVFVTEIYRLGEHGTRRSLNVYINGINRDVWEILNCYQPRCYPVAQAPAVKAPPVAPKPLKVEP
jgi:hypothetical protein